MDPRLKLIESGLVLSAELSLPVVLQRIVDLAVEITGARYGALGVVGPDGGISEFITTGMTQAEVAAIGGYPQGKGILGALMDEGHPMRMEALAEDPRSVGFPPNHPPMHSFLGAPVRARGRVFGNIYLTEKAGGPFTDEDEQALEVLAAQAGIAIENARQYSELTLRERSLDSLREITNAILVGTPMGEALLLVAARARELVGSDVASISIPTEDGQALRIEAAAGPLADDLMGSIFPYEGSVSGTVVASGQPERVADMSADPRAYQPVVAVGRMGPALFVPLSVESRPFGTLGVINTWGGSQFSEEDLRIVETFAGQAAVVIEYARVHEELRRFAVMEDRERIAKELHDGVIQALFAVGMGLQATAALSSDEDVESRLEQSGREIDRAIRDLRNYIFGLQPGILADRQLGQALRELAADFESKSGVTTVVDIREDVAAELASRAGDVVQVTRESLSNIGRHAQALTCSVRLSRDDDEAVLEIDDDGRGFDLKTARRDGNGVRNIRDRAQSLGGWAEITSTPGEGTTITVHIPIT